MRFLIFTKVFFPFFFAYFVASAQEIRMAYSDLIPNDFQEFLYNDKILLEKDSNAEIMTLSANKLGSLPMIKDFLSDRFDICVLALPEGNDFPILDEDKVAKIPFCFKSSVVVVNEENPVSEITLDQLAAIFSSSSNNSNLLTWRDVGLFSSSANYIKAYAVKGESGIATDLFRFSVLSENFFNSTVTFDTEENVKRLIIQDKAAVGLFPNIPENSNLKVLFLAQDDESIAYGPSIENLYYSDYFIRLPFYIVYNKRDSARLLPLVRILLSDSVADILDNNKFFPLPNIIREKLIIDIQLYLQENE